MTEKPDQDESKDSTIDGATPRGPYIRQVARAV